VLSREIPGQIFFQINRSRYFGPLQSRSLTAGFCPLDGIHRTDIVTCSAIGACSFIDDVEWIPEGDSAYRADGFARTAGDAVVSTVMSSHGRSPFFVGCLVRVDGVAKSPRVLRCSVLSGPRHTRCIPSPLKTPGLGRRKFCLASPCVFMNASELFCERCANFLGNSCPFGTVLAMRI